VVFNLPRILRQAQCTNSHGWQRIIGAR